MPKPDDAQNPLAPVALSGVPAPQPAEVADGKKALAAIDLLSRKPIPSQPKAKAAKTKTLSQLAEEIFAEGAE